MEAPGRLLSSCVESQMPLVQNNRYAKAAYLGIAHFDPLQIQMPYTAKRTVPI